MHPEYTVFSKPACTYCDQAKGLLLSKKLSFEVIDIVAEPTQRELMFAKVENASGVAPKTMPQIFRGDHYIGGFEQLKQHLNQ